MNNLSNLFGAQSGAASLMFVVLIIFLIATGLVYALHTGIKVQMISANSVNAYHASNASQAGIQFGAANLILNAASISDGDSLSASLGSGSNYSSQYTFLSGNQDIVKISSQGSFDNGSARSSEVIYKAITLINGFPTTPVGGRGDVVVRSNSEVHNLYSSETILTGDDAEIRSNSQTILSSGVSSTHTSMGPDVTQNDAAMAAMSDSELQSMSFGADIADIIAEADVSYSNTVDYIYNAELAGVVGQIVHISQTNNSTAQYGSNNIIGSEAQPVVIVVEGNFDISSNTTLHGTIIATGDVTVRSNAIVNGLVFGLGNVSVNSFAQVNGAVISGGEVEIHSNSIVNYEPRNMGSAYWAFSDGYGVVAGSWKDF